MVEERIEKDQRRALLTSKIPARPRESIDDNDSGICLRHDRQPGLNVTPKDLMLSSRMRLEIP
jgi:hypothetical protein